MMRISNEKRKMLRLSCFLLSTLLMVTVSATVYNYMYMQPTIGSKTAKLTFAAGTDATAAGTSVGTNGTYVSFTSLSGWPNATPAYENATVIKNNDVAVDFACQLSSDSWSDNTGNIEELNIRIYNAVGTLQGPLDVKVGNTLTFTIPHGETWRLEWRIKWSAAALSTDSITATLTLKVTIEGTGE